MDESIHKFLCPCCKVFIFGANTIRLASNLNEHNSDKHPFESSNWTASGIVFSNNYVGPATPNANWNVNSEVEVDTRKPLGRCDKCGIVHEGEHRCGKIREEYTRPHGTNENSRMTPEGRRVLESLGVKW